MDPENAASFDPRTFPDMLSVLVTVGASGQYVGQGSDGNPHNWDRRRRCDGTDYTPACGVCEGYGGIPTGDANVHCATRTQTHLLNLHAKRTFPATLAG